MEHTIYVSAGQDLQTVLDQAPENAVIVLPEGTWRQKLLLRTRGLTLIGAGADRTKIIFDDYGRKRYPSGQEYITFRSYTLAVCADGVTIRGLSVINDTGHPETLGQQIALSVVADSFLMEDCILSSTQDTLFTGPLPPDLQERYRGFLAPELCRGGHMRQTFRNCRIEGTVDFIFGCGESLFENCELRSRPDARGIGYVAAPAHPLYQKTGYRFRNCRLSCDSGVTPGSIYLARPWRAHGLCVFENCSYAGHIAPTGFDGWGSSGRDRTARFREIPQLPGRAPWINRR